MNIEELKLKNYPPFLFSSKHSTAGIYVIVNVVVIILYWKNSEGNKIASSIKEKLIFLYNLRVTCQHNNCRYIVYIFY